MNRVSSVSICSLALVLCGCLCVSTPKEYKEAPFTWPPPGDPPGPAYVLGTADFGMGIGVQVKVQVEPFSIPETEDEATFEVWSGSTAPAPSDASVVPPPESTLVYQTGGDVSLSHWTNHLDRTRDPDVDLYWLFVRVNRKGTPGNPRVIDHFVYSWTPSDTPVPDEVHQFIEL